MTEYENRGFLAVITGPKGVGKDSVIRELGFNKITSFTTRQPRLGEIDGQDYNFITREEFLKMCERGEFIESCRYPGCGKTEFEYKGTSCKEFGRIGNGENLVWKVAPSFAAGVKDTIRGCLSDKADYVLANMLIFYVGTPSLRELSRRLTQRDNGSANRQEISRTLQREWETWLQHKDSYDNVVINETGDPGKTAAEIMNIINSSRVRS